MDLLGIHHAAIRVTDLERVAAFYREVLGLQELMRHKFSDGTDRSIWLALPGGGFLALEKSTGAIEPSGSRAISPGHCLLAFRIWRDQRAAIVDELLSKRVVIVHQSRWTIYVADPEGNRIGLSHYPQDVLPPSREQGLA
jgi:glyoxylase I family protein